MTNEQATLIRQESLAAAKAWTPALSSIEASWHDRVPDWKRVFPGLTALIGIQTMLWSEWMRLVRVARGDGDSPSSELPLYTAPPASAGQVWRFAYTAVAPNVAWAFVSGPGCAPWETTLSALSGEDVAKTLGSLTAEGKVLTYGQASVKLMPLQGNIGKGDRPLGLPICDCDQVAATIPAWRDSAANVSPVMSRIVRELYRANPQTDAGLAFAELAWGIWAELLRSGCITVGVRDERRGLARLRAPQQHPFEGLLVLRGDHYVFWQQIRTVGAPQLAAE